MMLEQGMVCSILVSHAELVLVVGGHLRLVLERLAPIVVDVAQFVCFVVDVAQRVCFVIQRKPLVHGLKNQLLGQYSRR